ncbi:HbrB-like-domain-containing protein [Kalaharituber pfeilii]|nr:HbrB-like-domain-containing protein [Kalaharituber pfeilii]
MKSRRSPRSKEQQQHPQDPPPALPVPTTPSSHRPRSPSSSSAASASSVSSVLQSTSTSKMPLRTPTNHPSPGYQGYFDPHTQQQQQQQHLHHQPPQPTSTAQIVAAQAAMQASSKKRSQTAPSPKSPPGHANSAAGAAASAVMPRSALDKHFESANSSTATITSREVVASPITASYGSNVNTSPTATKKESSSKMNKLFSSRIGTPSSEKGQKPPPSPNKISHSIISNPIPRIGSSISGSERKASFSSSTVALVGAATATATDVFSYAPPQAPYASSIYSSSPPASSSGKEHHRPHFLRVRKDNNTVALSSASSNSKPISADGSSIYTFIPSSPSSSVFAQTHSKSSSTGDTKYGSAGKDHDFMAQSVDDWGFVRRNVGALFEGEQLRTPVEDMNKYIVNHIRRCYERKKPEALINDVNDILDGGMLSLDPTLLHYPDDKLVPRLVEIWHQVFVEILPYFEAVFLPLQQEFKGVGQVMNSREARDFWIEIVEKEGGGDTRVLDTRRMALVSFRDNVILPLHGRLRIVFSRLQLDFSSDLPNVTENVARVLQCISVLASILSRDEAQAKIDELAKTLKHNWLSRGRAGRNRRGFVGTKTKPIGVA